MNITTGCKNIPTVEELIASLPGANKDIYEDDAEDLLEQISGQNAMKPVSAWKELCVTEVREKELDLNNVSLKCPYLAGLEKEGNKVYGVLVTAGSELHQMLADCDDIMQEYILGFLMSSVLTEKMVDVTEEIAAATGLPHVQMIMAGIPEVCGIDQQIQVEKMMPEEFEALSVSVKRGGNLTPAYSSTAFLVFSDKEANMPSDWTSRSVRSSFGKKLFEMAGHS